MNPKQEALHACRLSAYLMNEVIKELRLGNLGERFHGDVIEDWQVLDTKTIKAMKNGYLVAHIDYLDNGRVHIDIPDAHRLIRTEHLKDFYPEQYGITINRIPDWKGDTDPDLSIDTLVPDDIPIPTGPRMPYPKTVHRTRFKVKSSIR